MRADSTHHMWYIYSITLIPVGDYDREFGSFFQWKTKRNEGNLRNSKQN